MDNVQGETWVAAGGQQLIAVVDDDAGVRDSLRFLLQAAGHEVETYASALEYLSAGSACEATCLIVDQHMPQLTGLEMVAALRRRGEKPHALLMTVSVTPDILTRAAQLGVSQVLEKPLDDENLLVCIEARPRVRTHKSVGTTRGGVIHDSGLREREDGGRFLAE